jgi:putative PIN family toxin of toxin-antitoxin system
MRIVLDTNCLLVSVPSKSPYRIVFVSLLKNKYTLLITNEILSEYREIIGEKTNAKVAENIAELLLALKNVEKTEVFFKWNLIEKDKDDNKFTDCAVSGNADFIVTNDKHFQVLKRVEFPKLNVLSLDDFLKMLKN